MVEEGQLSLATQKLLQLEGMTYQFKQEKIGNMDLTEADDRIQIGFIAQDIRELFPELVHEDEDGFLAVNYTGLIPVLVEGVKEQQATISDLNNKLKRLETQMEAVLNAIQK